MTEWSAAELETIAAEDEIHLSSQRPDGSFRPAITMWTVQVGGDVVVRSARQVNPWYERALASGGGRISIGRLQKDVLFTVFDGSGEPVDDAYHRKYDRYGARIVAGVVGPGSHGRTLLITPSS